MKNDWKTLSPIEVQIDELVLRGFPTSDRYRISEAVETELASLFATHRLPESLKRNGFITSINAGSIQIQPQARAAVVGSTIAQAVFGGLREQGLQLKPKGK